MAEGKYVSYLRVSTARQGASGLGLDAQRKAIEDHLNGGRWALCAEFLEVESGKQAERPELERAIAACRLYGARLLIARLDRLSRDVHFLTGLQKAGVQFTAVDMPEANELVVHILAAVAQAEGKAISLRTKLALAVAKDRGTKLGGRRAAGHDLTSENRAKAVATRQTKAQARAEQLRPVFTELWKAGHETMGALARELTAKGIPTATGSNAKWTAQQVKRVLDRLGG
jgi:DNA invertase Pin-like site-specific DNA recombinase